MMNLMLRKIGSVFGTWYPGHDEWMALKDLTLPTKRHPWLPPLIGLCLLMVIISLILAFFHAHWSWMIPIATVYFVGVPGIVSMD